MIDMGPISWCERLIDRSAVLEAMSLDAHDGDRAVDLLEQAAALYEKAMMIEDADEIAALLQPRQPEARSTKIPWADRLVSAGPGCLRL